MNKILLLSEAKIHGKGEMRNLASKLNKKGIPTLLTYLAWPRDEIIFFPEGNYSKVQRGTSQKKWKKDFAFEGGTFLKGDNFILGSESGTDKTKREETHKVLEVAKGYYFDISGHLEELKNIKVSKNKDFFRKDFAHMDIIYNIGNESKTIFTYNHPKLINQATEMINLTKYNLSIIPLEEAKYAAIGFVEFGDKIILDKRAKETKKILERIGYEVITTNNGLKKTNNQYGSLHCITTELPFGIDRLELKKILKGYFNPDLDFSPIYNLKKERVEHEDTLRIKLK